MSTLSIEALTAITWSLTAVAIILTIGRIIIRTRILKVFGLEDALHIFACSILIIYNIVYNASFQGQFDAVAFVNGTRPDLTYHEWERFFRLEMTVSLLFWIIVYAVKFSFLVFYRSLFQVSITFMRFWWAVFVLTWVTFGACFIALFWSCGSPSKILDVASCLDPRPNAIPHFIRVTCALNVFSDCTIMLLPLWMIKGMNIPPAQKLGVAGIFCVGILDVVMDILRAKYTAQKLDRSLNIVWNILEGSIAVIVCAIPTYRALFSNSGGREVIQARSYKNLAARSDSRPNLQEHQLTTF